MRTSPNGSRLIGSASSHSSAADRKSGHKSKPGGGSAVTAPAMLRGGRRARRRAPGDATEDGAGHQPRPAGIIVIEDPADQLTGGEEPGNDPLLAVHYLPVGRDAQPTEGERDPGRDGVAHERWRIERLSPVRFRRRDAARALAVLDRRIERPGHDGLVEGRDGADEPVDGGSLGLRHLADAVLLAQQRDDLLVEDLEGGAARLLDDGAAVLDVGVVAEVGALVHEALD